MIGTTALSQARLAALVGTIPWVVADAIGRVLFSLNGALMTRSSPQPDRSLELVDWNADPFDPLQTARSGDFILYTENFGQGTRLADWIYAQPAFWSIGLLGGALLHIALIAGLSYIVASAFRVRSTTGFAIGFAFVSAVPVLFEIVHNEISYNPAPGRSVVIAACVAVVVVVAAVAAHAGKAQPAVPGSREA